MKRSLTNIIACALILTGLSCVTVNVYFPSAEVEAAADRIVEEVYSSETDATGPTSWYRPILQLFATPAAYADDINIDVSTPAIRGLLARIEERHAKLVSFYDAGAIGISSKGYLEVRDTSGLGLREKADLTKQIGAENTDRETLYKEIVKANDLDSGSVADVERIFAAKWREKARKGWQVQSNSGEWGAK